MNLLNDKVAVVTGSGRGIGRAIAMALASQGASVVINDVDAESAEKTAQEIRNKGGKARPNSNSVFPFEEAEKIIAFAIKEFGKIDILVNNAGLIRDAMIHKMTEEDWDLVINTHLKGTFGCTRAAAKFMREKKTGRIINVTSYAGLRGNIGQANYSAAKAGIIGLTKASAKELARFSITVNAISPNAKTRMTEHIPKNIMDSFVETIPMKYFAEPEQMAPAVVFLVSDEANYITGQILGIDGGFSI